MQNITLSNVPASAFRVCAADVADNTRGRADIVSGGRLLMMAHARNAEAQIRNNEVTASELNQRQYAELNEKFQDKALVYAARKACELTGEPAPENAEEFRKCAASYMNNAGFYRVLSGLFQEIVKPILPAVYSTAVSYFANVHEVGFNQTYELSIGSNAIPVFQDTAWGALRSVPANRFYAQDFTLNPRPRSAKITAKFSQIINNGFDFGAFFGNLAAGMYAKTMGLWASGMTAAASDTTLIPSGYSVTYSTTNWAKLANKVAAANGTGIRNVIAYGGSVACSKALPKDALGTTGADMDAAIATLLGADYLSTGYIATNMGVRIHSLQDAMVPGTENSTGTMVLPEDKIWMMSATGRKPMEICYNSATPMTIEMTPDMNSNGEISIILTMAIDCVSVFASRVGLVNI